jgi:hypothetical protein
VPGGVWGGGLVSWASRPIDASARGRQLRKWAGSSSVYLFDLLGRCVARVRAVVGCGVRVWFESLVRMLLRVCTVRRPEAGRVAGE